MVASPKRCSNLAGAALREGGKHCAGFGFASSVTPRGRLSGPPTELVSSGNLLKLPEARDKLSDLLDPPQVLRSEAPSGCLLV